jgi:hypothetical protein
MNKVEKIFLKKGNFELCFKKGEYYSMSGADPLSSFYTGMSGSLVGSAAIGATGNANQVVRSITTMGTGALTSGTIEAIQGGNFGEGLAIGLTISIVNHSFHDLMTNDGGGSESSTTPTNSKKTNKKYIFKTRKELEEMVNSYSGEVLRGSLNDWGNYLGFGVGAAEYNLGKVIADRAKYSFTPAPYETRIHIKGNTIIRTPIGNLSVDASKLANRLKSGGRALGGAGIVLTVIQANNIDISYGEAALDGSFGVVSFFGIIWIFLLCIIIN